MGPSLKIERQDALSLLRRAGSEMASDDGDVQRWIRQEWSFGRLGGFGERVGGWKRVASSLGHVTLALCLGGCGLWGDRDPIVEGPMDRPTAVALDADGNLYVADSHNHRVRRIDPSGTVTTVAGSGRWLYDGDGGPAIKAALYYPEGVAVDSTGNLYIADTLNNRVRRVDPSGTITTVAGTGVVGGGGDGGPATEAQLAFPKGVAVDADDNLYIADNENGRIRRIDRSGTITTIAGIGDGDFSGDGGPAIGARLDSPTGVAVDSGGNLYIADTENHRIRRVDRSGAISTVAGTGVGGYGGDGGPATEAQLREPSGLALDSSGTVYIADTWNNRVRMIDSSGVISTVAGNEKPSSRGDRGDHGPAIQAPLEQPVNVAVDSAGNLFIVESGTYRVRRVDTSGTISTVAGNGKRAYSGDGGPATESALGAPQGVVADSSGNIYIADSANHRVRRVDPAGTISTVAGTGVGGYSGDGGPATEARLHYPTDLTVDSSGTLYIVDMGNYRVRRIDPSGRISTVGYYHQGGPKLLTALWRPSRIALDSSGRLYVTDVSNHRVHRIDRSGNVSRVTGAAAVERGGDGGVAVEAELYEPIGLAFDQAGNLYFTEGLPPASGESTLQESSRPWPGRAQGVAAGEANPTWRLRWHLRQESPSTCRATCS